MPNAEELKELIRRMSMDLGFDAIGFTEAGELSEDSVELKKWLSWGFHADMNYMANNFDKRIAPDKLVSGAKTVVVFLKNYYPLEILSPSSFKVSKYAYGRDYHKVLKKKLQQILATLQEGFGIEGRVFVDSAPVLERALARKAGLGFIGKNSCLISKEIGSFCFISEMMIDADLVEENNDVIDACPTDAIVGPKVVDASKCISYLSIEKKEELNDGQQALLAKDKFIFGCDICQDVCPWNSKILPTSEKDFSARQGITRWENKDWEQMDEQTFFETFAGTPLMRAGYKQMRRNVAVIRSDSSLD